MSNHRLPLCVLATLVGGAACLSGCAPRSVAVGSASAASKGGGRENVTLTVYADGFAQVSERRPFELRPGSNQLGVADVSKMMDPSSALFNWADPSIQVVSNTYDLGIGSPSDLVQRYLGEKVGMVWYGQDGKPGQREEGTLAVGESGGIVLRTKDGLLVNPTGTLVMPERDSVVTIPQLTLGVESQKAGRSNLDLTYLTRGFTWSADYVATLDPNGDSMRLECWASVTNGTGIDYPKAKLTLVAGSPNRATRVAERRLMYAARMPATDSAGFAPQDSGIVMNKAEAPVSLGELQAYPIKAAASIIQSQINRVRMLYSPKVLVKRDYSVEIGSGYAYYDSYTNATNTPRRQSAQLSIAVVNTVKDGLGVPLPAGSIRFYEPDDSQANRYIGAASINDTPEKGRMDLTISNVFNVYAQTTLAKSTRVDKRQTRQQTKVVLSNRKKTLVELRVVKRFAGTWKIESETSKSARLDASTNQWKIAVPPGGDVELEFTALLGP